MYYVLCLISPPGDAAEAKSMPFEALGKREVLVGVHGSESEDIESAGNVDVTETMKI